MNKDIGVGRMREDERVVGIEDWRRFCMYGTARQNQPRVDVSTGTSVRRGPRDGCQGSKDIGVYFTADLAR